MARTIPNPEPAAGPDAPPTTLLDYQRLDAYRLAVEFQAIAVALCADRRLGATLRDQLDRASVSIVLCIAEGVGRTAKDTGRAAANTSAVERPG